MNIEQLSKFIDAYKEEITSLTWSKNDVRHSFYALHYTVLHDYYIGNINYILGSYIVGGKVSFKEDIYHFKSHIDRIVQTYTNEIANYTYVSQLTRGQCLEAGQVLKLLFQ